MRHGSILRSSDDFRRPGVSRRRPAASRLVPSQDVSRYQARNMPPPTYDLDPRDVRASLLTILVPTLAVVATGAGVVLIERIGVWLAP